MLTPFALVQHGAMPRVPRDQPFSAIVCTTL